MWPNIFRQNHFDDSFQMIIIDSTISITLHTLLQHLKFSNSIHLSFVMTFLLSFSPFITF